MARKPQELEKAKKEKWTPFRGVNGCRLCKRTFVTLYRVNDFYVCKDHKELNGSNN